MVECHHVSVKRHVATASVRSKSLARLFPRICVARGRNLERRHLGRTHWGLEQMDASEIHAKRLNAKDVLTPMSGENFIFPIADGTVKLSGGDQVLTTSTSIWDRPDRGEEQENLQRESDGSSSTRFNIHRCMMLKQEMISGPFLGTSYTATR